MHELRRSRGALLATLGIVALVAPGSLAGGWDNGIVGPRAPGMATAFVGLADDASTIFYNPGGLALLEEESGLAGTLRYTGANLRYDFPEGQESATGRDHGTAYLTGIVPDLFYYSKFDDVAVGLGFYIPYGGLAGAWAPDTFGVKLDQLMAVSTLTPTISWAITPWLSIGAGPNIYIGFMKSKAQWDELPLALFAPEFAENLPEAPPGEGLRYLPISLEQSFYAYGVAVGFNAGVLVHASDRLSLGLAVRSGTDVSLEGPVDIKVDIAGPLAAVIESDLTVEYELPYLVTLGLSFRPIPELTLLADVQWNGWGSLEAVSVKLEKLDITQVQETGFENSVKFMLGGEYVFDPGHSVRLGYMYTPTNIKNESFLSYQSWDVDVHTFAFGLGYHLEEATVHLLASVSYGEAEHKSANDPGDPIGKPAGSFDIFNQSYGIGFTW